MLTEENPAERIALEMKRELKKERRLLKEMSSSVSKELDILKAVSEKLEVKMDSLNICDYDESGSGSAKPSQQRGHKMRSSKSSAGSRSARMLRPNFSPRLIINELLIEHSIFSALIHTNMYCTPIVRISTSGRRMGSGVRPLRSGSSLSPRVGPSAERHVGPKSESGNADPMLDMVRGVRWRREERGSADEAVDSRSVASLVSRPETGHSKKN